MALAAASFEKNNNQHKLAHSGSANVVATND